MARWIGTLFASTTFLALKLGDSPFVIFTGSNYAPNLEGAEFIVDTLAAEFPEVVFGIIGGVGLMMRERRSEGSFPPNVRLFGFVEKPQLLDLYHAADLALNPMLHGSGTNIKMFDAMAAGLPILSTSVGARGIEGEPSRHWIEADLEAMVMELKALLDEDCTPFSTT